MIARFSLSLTRIKGAASSSLVFVAVIVVISTCVLPLLYAVAAEGPNFAAVLTDERALHVMLNSAATGLVMLWSLRLTGRLDRQLAAVLNHVLLVHGVLAFEILVTRQFHSNKVLFTAAVVSTFLGSLVMLVSHLRRRPKIALLGRWHLLASELAIPVEHVDDPATPLSNFDLLLSTDVLSLSPEWSTPVAQAMLRGQQVRHLAEFVEECRGVVSIEHFDPEQISASRLNRYRFLKRLVDIGLVVVSAPLALPLFAIGALAVWGTMGMPVIFVQERVGLGGRPFSMYKLRTMRPTQGNDVSATSKGDLRITSAGRILRRFRIDELPQLWNVLKGDMSVIGPRPEQPSLASEYAANLPSFVYRDLVRPGITGWAQVRVGYASNLEETRVKLTYDLFYVKNFSFALDVQILFRTVWTLIGGGGVR